MVQHTPNTIERDQNLSAAKIKAIPSTRTHHEGHFFSKASRIRTKTHERKDQFAYYQKYFTRSQLPSRNCDGENRHHKLAIQKHGEMG